MKWKISNVSIDNQVVLAPMAGICDSAFRTIVKSMGCGLLGTEMVSSNAIMYQNAKTMKLLFMEEYERPISQQIFGCDINSFKIAARYIHENMKPEIIDINMGCPVNKVAIKGRAGSALLKNKELVSKIIESVVEEVPIPVTAKIRSGWDENSINAVEIAKTIEDAGASAITVHPRTRSQGYAGKSDWSIIKKVKETVDIPVIGNGDIRTCYDAKAMIELTGCDAIMIARGVLGNPWLIKECINYLDYGIKPRSVTLEERIAVLKKHVNMLIENISESIVIPKMRMQAAYYLKFQPRTIGLKKAIFQANTREELFRLLDEYMYNELNWNNFNSL